MCHAMLLKAWFSSPKTHINESAIATQVQQNGQLDMKMEWMKDREHWNTHWNTANVRLKELASLMGQGK